MIIDSFPFYICNAMAYKRKDDNRIRKREFPIDRLFHIKYHIFRLITNWRRYYRNIQEKTRQCEGEDRGNEGRRRNKYILYTPTNSKTVITFISNELKLKIVCSIQLCNLLIRCTRYVTNHLWRTCVFLLAAFYSLSFHYISFHFFVALSQCLLFALLK